jgi:hypothetical protein
MMSIQLADLPFCETHFTNSDRVIHSIFISCTKEFLTTIHIVDDKRQTTSLNHVFALTALLQTLTYPGLILHLQSDTSL